MSSMARRNVRLKSKRAAREVEAPATDPAVEGVRVANNTILIEMAVGFVEGDKVVGVVPVRLQAPKPAAGQPLRLQVQLDARTIYNGLGESLGQPTAPASGLVVAKGRVWRPGDPQ